jgi:hypothetical protein
MGRRHLDDSVSPHRKAPVTIILPALAITFAAFCVWLTVRIVNRRERWAKRTALAVVVLLGYPLSFGPACWFCSRLEIVTAGNQQCLTFPRHAAADRCCDPFRIERAEINCIPGVSSA